MWYKREIVRMIRKIGNEKALRYLWLIVKGVYEELNT